MTGDFYGLPTRIIANQHLRLEFLAQAGPRLCLGDQHILIESRPQPSAFKVGYMNRRGWIAYLRQGILFVKRFEPQGDQPHADMGCNVEVYCNGRFVEPEMLAPLSRLEPGQSVTHVERWELYTGPGTLQTADDVKALLHD